VTVELGTTIVRDFMVTDPTTGAMTNADSLPTCEVYDSSDTVFIAPTVALRDAGVPGHYRVPLAVTVGNGFEEGQTYTAFVTVIVGGVTSKAVLASFEVALSIPRGAVVADGSNSATTFETNLTESTDDHWKDALLVFVTGALAGQVKKVTGYNGTTKFVTVTPGFTAAPATGVRFILINA